MFFGKKKKKIEDAHHQADKVCEGIEKALGKQFNAASVETTVGNDGENHIFCTIDLSDTDEPFSSIGITINFFTR